jgi:hypothetical protein
LTLKEVEEAIGQALNNKAPGQDTIFNESIKYGGEQAAQSCFFLFTQLFENGMSPSSWSKALIHLIFKGGSKDRLSCSSYRPISLISIVSKIYERVLLNRAGDTYAEEEELLPDEQAGFRKGRSPMEQTYLLREILDERKRLTFICFVDMASAFPSTWREAIWSRMQEAGITGKLYRAVQSLYENCTSAVLTAIGTTEWFPIESGTRQGAVLSPFLFSLVISPLVRALAEQGLGIQTAGKLIACLLFADDIALIAGSEAELRRMMVLATSFFHKWRFTVSTSKTRIVAFGAGETAGPLKDRPWTIGGKVVKEASFGTYLGIDFEKRGWASILKTNAVGARDSANRLASVTQIAEVGLKVGHLARLYDTYSRPRVMYGAEVWAVTSATGMRKLEVSQNSACRHSFARRGGANVIEEAARGDLGWLTMQSRVTLVKLRFYSRLCRLDDSRLVKIVFWDRQAHMKRYLEERGTLLPPNTSWCGGIYHALQTLDLLSYWPDCSHITPRDWNKLCLDKARSLDFTNLQENCDVMQAGRRYAQLKTTPGQEKYLMRHDRYSMLIKFWLRASCLGLRARVEHDDDADKICVLCNSGEQETERHFLLDCAAFAQERQVVGSQLEHALVIMEYADADFLDPRLTLLHASPNEPLRYLLGATHPEWPAEAEEVIDATLRPFLISLTRQRTLLSSADEQPSLSDSDEDALDSDEELDYRSVLEPFSARLGGCISLCKSIFKGVVLLLSSR